MAYKKPSEVSPFWCFTLDIIFAGVSRSRGEELAHHTWPKLPGPIQAQYKAYATALKSSIRATGIPAAKESSGILSPEQMALIKKTDV